MHPTLLSENDDWQAWDKPAGFTVHNESPSLLEFLKKREPRTDWHFLNRLDKDTSGLVIVTKSARAVEPLQNAWAADTTMKIYVGLHRKRREPAVKDPEIWDESLSDRNEGHRQPRGKAAERVPCRTRFFPLETSPHLVLSAMILETGRQHQIRRHALLHGLELVGDPRYGDRAYNSGLKNHISDLRLGLHAFALLGKPFGKEQGLIAPLPEFFLKPFPAASRSLDLFLAARSGRTTVDGI